MGLGWICDLMFLPYLWVTRPCADTTPSTGTAAVLPLFFPGLLLGSSCCCVQALCLTLPSCCGHLLCHHLSCPQADVAYWYRCAKCAVSLTVGCSCDAAEPLCRHGCSLLSRLCCGRGVVRVPVSQPTAHPTGSCILQAGREGLCVRVWCVRSL